LTNTEKPKNVNERIDVEKPKREPAPVARQRLVMQLYSPTID